MYTCKKPENFHQSADQRVRNRDRDGDVPEGRAYRRTHEPAAVEHDGAPAPLQRSAPP